jgi:hypothetical protein
LNIFPEGKGSRSSKLTARLRLVPKRCDASARPTECPISLQPQAELSHWRGRRGNVAPLASVPNLTFSLRWLFIAVCHLKALLYAEKIQSASHASATPVTPSPLTPLALCLLTEYLVCICEPIIMLNTLMTCSEHGCFQHFCGSSGLRDTRCTIV